MNLVRLLDIAAVGLLTLGANHKACFFVSSDSLQLLDNVMKYCSLQPVVGKNISQAAGNYLEPVHRAVPRLKAIERSQLNVVHKIKKLWHLTLKIRVARYLDFKGSSLFCNFNHLLLAH